MTENTSRFNHGKSLGKVKKISNTEKMKIKYNSYATRKSVNYFSCLHAIFHNAHLYARRLGIKIDFANHKYPSTNNKVLLLIAKLLMFPLFNC